jgi:hypothetical protein
MNAMKLPQDHPCVIETIRQHYLNKPPPPDAPLKLDSNDLKDRSPGQTGVIFRLLKNMVLFFSCSISNISQTCQLVKCFDLIIV